MSPRNKNPILVKVYLARIEGELNMPDGSDEDIKVARWVGDFEGYNLAPVAGDIIESLKRDNYF